MKPTDIAVHIRWMIRRDLADIIDIEQASFPHPWTEEDFLRCLRQRNCIGMVAEHQERIVGYMVYKLNSDRLTLCNLAVTPVLRHCGIGRQMVEVARKLAAQKRRKLEAFVRETNLDAQLFFKSCGFWATRLERDYYDDSTEDAIVFEWLASVMECVGK